MRPGAALKMLFSLSCFFAFNEAGYCCDLNYTLTVNTCSQDTAKKDKPKKIDGCTTIANVTGNTCLGSVLTATATDPIASVEWTYQEPGTLANSTLVKQAGGGPFTFKADVAGGYFVKIVTKTGCEVPPSNTITVTNPKVPVIEITTKSNVVCAQYPDPVFTALPPLYNGEFPAYQWKVNEVNAGQPTKTLTSFSVHGLKKGDKVTYEMTSSDNCVTTPTVISNPIVIDDIPVDKPSVSIEQRSRVPCAGSALLFAAVTTSAGDAPEYQWYLNGRIAPDGTESTFTSDQLTEGDLLVCKIVGNARICQITNLAESLPFAVITLPLVIPAITVSASATTADAGTPIRFTATGQNKGPHPIYRWQVNRTNAASATDEFTVSNLKDGDQVTCTLISDADCTSTNTITADPITVHINAIVQVVTPSTFTPNGDGVNDTWQISGLELFADVKVKIYDRYGQSVYESAGYSKAWAGTTASGSACPPGVYYYFINLDGKKVQSGSVTIIK